VPIATRRFVDSVFTGIKVVNFFGVEAKNVERFTKMRVKDRC
jgi:hypothetical protein